MKRTLLALCLAAAAAAATPEKTFILKSSTRDLDEFRGFVKIAARLKPYGRVQVDIGILADKSWYEMPSGGSAWHEYATDAGAMYKFFPHPKIAPFLPAEWVAANRKLLLAKAAMLREAGLDAAFSSNDTHFLPEEFFRKYPELRGPRVDHPRRSRHEEFSWCVDRPETLEMIEWMAAELKRNVPEIKTVMSLNNDSGSGLCWSAALYSGPNGPAFCKGRHVGTRVRGLLEAIHRGFEKGGGKVVTRLHGNFWQNEDEIVLAHLPPDSFLDSKDRTAMHVGTLAVDAYPVLGLINPLGVYAAMERYRDAAVRTVFVGTGPYYNRFDEPLETASRLVDLIEDSIAEPAQGLLQRFDKTRRLALKSAGEQNAAAAFEAFYNMDQAFRLKQAAAPKYSNLYCGVSMRHMTRPAAHPARPAGPGRRKLLPAAHFQHFGERGAHGLYGPARQPVHRSGLLGRSGAALGPGRRGGCRRAARIAPRRAPAGLAAPARALPAHVGERGALDPQLLFRAGTARPQPAGPLRH